MFGILDERMGLKKYLDGPMDAATNLKYEVNAVRVDLQERRKRLKNVKIANEERSRCVDGNAHEDHIIM